MPNAVIIAFVGASTMKSPRDGYICSVNRLFSVGDFPIYYVAAIKLLERVHFLQSRISSHYIFIGCWPPEAYSR